MVFLDWALYEQKPVASTATQMIHAEIAKENTALSDLDKEKEENAAKTKAIETKIREVGVEYKEKVWNWVKIMHASFIEIH